LGKENRQVDKQPRLQFPGPQVQEKTKTKKKGQEGIELSVRCGRWPTILKKTIEPTCQEEKKRSREKEGEKKKKPIRAKRALTDQREIKEEVRRGGRQLAVTKRGREDRGVNERKKVECRPSPDLKSEKSQARGYCEKIEEECLARGGGGERDHRNLFLRPTMRRRRGSFHGRESSNLSHDLGRDTTTRLLKVRASVIVQWGRLKGKGRGAGAIRL